MDIDFQYIHTNNIDLHMAVAGPEEGELVVLLHGFPEFWYSWRRQIRVLAQAGYRVIAPDQRGYNKSDKPAGVGAYAINILKEDIIGLIDHFNRDEAAIVGHDWGGAVGWHLASINPERVKCFTAINMAHPGVFPEVMMAKPTQILKSAYMLFFQLPRLPEFIMSSRDYSNLEQMLKVTSKKGTFSDNELGAYNIAWSRHNALKSMLNWYRAIPHSIKSIDKKSKVEVPVKIIWGSSDQFLSQRLAEESLKYTHSQRVVWVNGATHWVHQEYPDFVNEQILQFLDEHK
ncbi:epoxide hydrolase EphM [Salinicoccus jeotgali]|uniref:Epoxide hydrolase EphM n=1 Tax=Salinicoccus jeotgali TaxID=381634 RepID=A0ABP7F2C1_9STAP